MLTPEELRQPHLSFGLEGLSDAQRTAFFHTLTRYGLATLARQRALLQKQKPYDLTAYKPLSSLMSCEEQPALFGEQCIRQGKVGALILAGGQATRLNCAGPKGALPVTPKTRKSLFHLLAERIHAAGRQAGRELLVAVMTSPFNHVETLRHFEENHFFGLSSDPLFFFPQSLLPLLDEQGNWLLEQPGLLACGPDGNGNALLHFYEQGLHAEWQQRGVEYVNVLFVDNPLADPFDPEFIGFTASQQLEVGVKAIERLSLEEKMGLLVEERGKIKVVEYSEFIPETSASYRYGSPGQFCFSMEFIQSLCKDKSIILPWHLAHKRAKVIPAGEEAVRECMVYKCETFQFDLLDYAKRSAAILYRRERCYAPLKNAVGDKSLQTLLETLLAIDEKRFT